MNDAFNCPASHQVARKTPSFEDRNPANAYRIAIRNGECTNSTKAPM
jgi:hypothetical protein